MKEKRTVLELPKDDQETIKRAMRRTWELLAPDALDAGDQEYLDQDEVVELVLDADRMNDHGGLAPFLMYALKNTKYQDLVTFAKNEVFTDETYG